MREQFRVYVVNQNNPLYIGSSYEDCVEWITSLVETTATLEIKKVWIRIA